MSSRAPNRPTVLAQRIASFATTSGATGPLFLRRPPTSGRRSARSSRPRRSLTSRGDAGLRQRQLVEVVGSKAAGLDRTTIVNRTSVSRLRHQRESFGGRLTPGHLEQTDSFLPCHAFGRNREVM